MEKVGEILGLLSNPAKVMPLLVAMAVFMFVLSAIFTWQWTISRKRIKTSIGIEEITLADKMVEIASPVSGYILPKGTERLDVNSRLVQAGIYHPNSITILYVIKLFFLVILPLSILLGNAWWHLPLLKIGMYVAMAFGAGLIAPS